MNIYRARNEHSNLYKKFRPTDREAIRGLCFSENEQREDPLAVFSADGPDVEIETEQV